MPCYRIPLEGGGVAIACTRGPAKKELLCGNCGQATATRLCDGKSGRKRCSAPLCDQCAHTPEAGVDLCPNCRPVSGIQAKLFQASQPR